MTQVGKAKLDHPALSTAGGGSLHAAIETLFEKISDHLPARWQLFESVANGGSVTFEHGFEVPLSDLRVHLYLKGVSSNTKVTDLSTWSILATSGYAQTKLDITAPSSGGPFDFYLYVSHEPMDDKLSVSGGTMTGSLLLSADPTQDLHAASKRYVDSVAQGLDPKASVKVATTANIGLSGTMTIDGVAVAAGDRVLVKNQTTDSQNGIYVVGVGAWSRASDMDSWTEVPSAFVFVQQGTENADKGYVCTADQGGTIGTTAISWVQFAGAGSVTSGSGGISVSANAVSLALSGSTLDQTSGLKVADGGISNTQIASNAAIADSKLAKVTTAGKVSGDAITDGTIGGSTAITTTGTAAFNGTSYLKIPVGIEGQRPALNDSVNGMIRFNSTSLSYEGFKDGAWSSLGGGGTVARVFSVYPSFTAYGNIARMDAQSLAKADATNSSNGEVLGIVTKVYASGYDRDITGVGEVKNLTASNFAEGSLPASGSVVFLSTTPGLMSVNEPTTVGQVSVPLGVVTWSDPGEGVCTVNFAPKRGVVVGGANARTQVSLSNNVSNQTIQNVGPVGGIGGYDAGELAGWVHIDATTDLRFYVQAQFVKGGNGNYNISYQTSGDTPPANFSLSITNAGLIQYTMPLVAGFSTASINYALNAPAVGTNFPLSLDATAIVSGTPTFDTINEKTSANGVQIKGRTSGVAIPSGYVGEVFVHQTFTATLAVGTGQRGLTTFSIPSAGLWRIEVTAWVNCSGDTGGSSLILSTVSATSPSFPQLYNVSSVSEYTDKSTYSIQGLNSRAGQNISCVATFTGSTTIYVNFFTVNSVSAASGSVKITAIATRIA